MSTTIIYNCFHITYLHFIKKNEKYYVLYLLQLASSLWSKQSKKPSHLE